ncbi:MAG: tetratricopeptide repeat protein [Andreesenia angusta]|nr:tetratricopeptide repeat protein [Andreesenia angusta]
MDNMKEYFKNFRDRVSFIELKKEASMDLNGYIVRGGLPLPIMMDDLIDRVKEISEEIKIVSIIKGMIHTIGIDEEFPYADRYKEILISYDKDIAKYIVGTGMTMMKEKNIDEAMIYFRAAYALDKGNIGAIYNYSIALEEKARNFYDEKNKEMGNKFLAEAMEKMIEVQKKDSEYDLPMCYYKLGFYYKAYSKFRKAKESWEKFIQIGKHPEIFDEVREAIEGIEDDTIYEEGYSLILENKAEEGLKKLLPLTERYKNWWNLDFMTGLGFRQLGQFDTAIDFFKRVLEINPTQIDTLNEMGLCKANLGDMNGALEFFDKAVKMNPNNHEIICNRGMTKLNLGDNEGAIEDIEKAYSINPEDEIVKSCMEIVKKLKS